MAKVHQRKTKKQRSLQQEDKDQEYSGSEQSGVHHPAVAVAYGGAANSAPVVQNKQNPSQLGEEGKKQQTTSPYQYHVPAQFAAVSPIQRKEEAETAQFSLFGATKPDFMMTDEEKKAKKVQEAKDLRQNELDANMPDCLSPLSFAKWESSFQVDENDSKAYNENKKYHEVQSDWISAWINEKKDKLDPFNLKVLKSQQGRVIERMQTPLSLKLTYKSLFKNNDLEGLELELQKIQQWLTKNGSNADAERLKSVEVNVKEYLNIAKKQPIQKAKDTKYNRWYYLASTDVSTEDLAFFMFGDKDKASLFVNFDNTSIGGAVYGGQPIFIAGEQNVVTTAGFNATLARKSLIKTNGEIGEPVSSGIQEFAIGDQQYKMPMHFYKSFARNKYQTIMKLLEIEKTDGIANTLQLYHDHKAGTNGVVRFFSNTVGGASFDEAQANRLIKVLDNIISENTGLSDEQLTPEKLGQLERMDRMAKSYDEAVRSDFQNYLNDGIAGAEKSIEGLTVVKEAGQIAGNFIPGVGFASGLVFDSVSQASEIANGVSDGWDYKRTATQGALSIVNKFGGKLVDKIPGVGKLASSGIAGKFVKETIENVVVSPLETITQSMIMKGEIPSLDSIAADVKDNLSLKSMAVTALGVGVQVRGNNTGAGFGKDTKSTAFGSEVLSGKVSLADSKVGQAVSGAGEKVKDGFVNSKVGGKIVDGIDSIKDKAANSETLKSIKESVDGVSEKASDLGGKIANSGPGKKLGRAADVVKDKAGRLGDKVIGGLETIDKVLTTDVKDLFKGSKDQKSDPSNKAEGKEVPSPIDFGDSKDAVAPAVDGGKMEVPSPVDFGESIADGRRGTDIKAESAHGIKDKSTASSSGETVKEPAALDNREDSTRMDPDQNATQIDMAPIDDSLNENTQVGGKPIAGGASDKAQLDQPAVDNGDDTSQVDKKIGGVDNHKTVVDNSRLPIIVFENLPQDSTIFDPNFKLNLSDAEMQQHITFMHGEYRAEALSNPDVEVGLVQNKDTGQLIIIKGDKKSVNSPSNKPLKEMFEDYNLDGNHWVFVSHFHPVGPSGKTRDKSRQPSGRNADFAGVQQEAQRQNRPVSEEIIYWTDDGFMTTKYGYDPKVARPYWTEIVDPVTGLVERRSYRSLEEYHDYLTNNFDSEGKKKDQVSISVDNERTQDEMAPIEDISNENTQVGGKPIARGASDKALQDQPAVDNWEDITQVDNRIGVVADVPTKPDGESLGSGIGGKDDQSRGNNNAKQNGKSVPAPIDFGSMEQTFGILPLGAVVKQQTASYIVYTYNGVDRIRFLAAASFTLKEANAGRNYSNDTLATLNSKGQPFVHEGRHRAIGAAKGGSIPLDGGGVADKPGILDFNYLADHFAGVGESVLNLKIDQSMPDVPAAVSEAFRTDQDSPTKKPKLNIEKGAKDRKTDRKNYIVHEHFGDVNGWGHPVARYFANFQLGIDGFIAAEVRMTDGTGNRSSMHGATEFAQAVEHFKKHPTIKLQGLRSTWGDGDNLSTFNHFFERYKALGATDEAAQQFAVRNTFSFKWAESAGFVRVNIIKAELGPSGEFTSVEVTFSR